MTHSPHLERPERLADIPSASTTVTRSQKRVLGGMAVLTVSAVVIAPMPALTALIGFVTLFYLTVFAYRIKLAYHAIGGADVVRVSDDLALAVPDDALPRYTVMIPAYGEPEVIGQLIDSMNALVYPRDRLEVKLLLEDDDKATISRRR